MKAFINLSIISFTILCNCTSDPVEPPPPPGIPKGNFITSMGYVANIKMNPYKKEIYYSFNGGIYAFNYDTKEQRLLINPVPGGGSYLHTQRPDEGIIFILAGSCPPPFKDCTDIRGGIYKYEINSGKSEKLRVDIAGSDFIFGENELFVSYIEADTLDPEFADHYLHKLDFDGNIHKLPVKGFPLHFFPGTTKLLIIDHKESIYRGRYERYIYNFETNDSTFLDEGSDYTYPELYDHGTKLISVSIPRDVHGIVTIYDVFEKKIIQEIPFESYILTSAFHPGCNRFVYTKSYDEFDYSTGNDMIILASVDLETGQELVNTQYNVEGIYEVMIDYECDELIYTLAPNLENGFNFNLYSATMTE